MNGIMSAVRLPVAYQSRQDFALHVADHVSVNLSYWDIHQICRFANNAYISWCGKSREDMVGRITLEEHLGLGYEDHLPYIQGVLEGTNQMFECDISIPSGETRHTMTTYTPDIGHGIIKGFFAQVVDITPVKKMEHIKSERKFRKLLESAPDAMVIIDSTGIIRLTNLRCETLFGYNHKELLGLHVDMIVPEQFREAFHEYQIRSCIGDRARSQDSVMELAGLRKGAEEFPVEINISPLITAEGTLVTIAIRDITQRKQIEDKLQIINEQNMHAMAMFDPQLRYLAVSGQWIVDYGLGDMELIGKPHYEIFPEISDEWKRIHQECLLGKVHKCSEARFERQDGSVQWINWEVRPWFLTKGRIGGLLMATSDITHLKKKEEERVRIENILDKTNKIARIGAWEVDLKTNTVTWTRVTQEIHEVDDTYQPTLKTGILFYREGDSRQRIIKAVDSAIFFGRTFDLELELVTATGRNIWTRVICEPEMVEDKCIRLIGVFQDISEQKKIREELLISEGQFRGAFEFSAIGMALVSNAGRWLKVNNELCNMLGYTPDELLSRTFLDITHPEDLGLDLLQLGQMLKCEIESYQMEKRYFHKDRSVVWVLLNVSMVTDQNGAPVHFIFQIENITKRKEIEGALQKINQELKAIFDSEHVSIIGTDTKGVITHFSKGAEAMLGYEATEMIGHFTPAVFLSAQEMKDREHEIMALFGKEIKDIQVFVELTRQHRHESREWSYIRKDGTTLPVQLVVTATTNDQEQITGFLGIATDTTHRKGMEETLRKYAILQAKTKEMEQFAYIASHDLREPLLTMQSYVDLIMEKSSECFDEETRVYLNSISTAASHMDILLKNLLDYSFLSGANKPEWADLNEYMHEAIGVLAPLIRESAATIELDNLPVLNACRPELKQVFYHLLKNAMTFRRSALPVHIKVSAVKRDHDWLFSFRDNGLGVDPGQSEKIFVIFQRLHNRGKYPGTGIGLAHCKRIVELHGGIIWVEPIPEGGSLFCFTLST